MEELHSYSPEDIVLANLGELSMRLARISEQELAHLHELAQEITAGADFTPEFLASLTERRTLSAPLTDGCLLQNAAIVGAKQAMEQAWRSIFLCKEIYKRLSEKAPLTPDAFFNDTEELEEGAVNRIIYQRNSYADEAYLRFSNLLTMPRATYAKSFAAACESVYNRECEYCILPIESSADGQLTGFWRLITRYGLKLTAICDITAANQTTRFALLRATPTVLTTARRANRFFDCSITDASRNLTNVLYAAQCCGLALSKIHSEEHFSKDASPHTVHLTFCADDGELTSFLLYLFLEQPTHTLIGLYPYLEP